MRRDNLPHVVVAVLVRDPAGRVYVHRVPTPRTSSPGMHDAFAAGCLQYGEEPAAAAAREVAEELGVVGVPLEPLFDERYEDAQHPAVVPRCSPRRTTAPITHQPEEVAWGGWMTPAELRARLADPDWPFVPDGRVAAAALGSSARPRRTCSTR